jgi:ferrous iron transport protein B
MQLNLFLAGNPNCGKSTIFNELTGLDQSVGNWPGVTVESEKGQISYGQHQINITDLPGIYSLFPPSEEQRNACRYLLYGRGKQPHIIINVVDSTNLERNLYLTSQLVETGLPVLIALCMYDELEQRGLEIDLPALSKSLGAPCVKLYAYKKESLDNLLDLCLEMALSKIGGDADVFWHRFPLSIREKQRQMEASLPTDITPHGIKPRWMAGQLLEGHWHGTLPRKLDMDSKIFEARISAERYSIIENIVARVLKKRSYINRNITRAIDNIVCHRLWALPIFFGIMFSILFMSFGPPGNALMLLCSVLFLDMLPTGMGHLLATLDAPFWFQSLIIDGMIAGVGGLMIFLPQLIMLFFFLALLEDSGYMARSSFLMDKALSSFGLGGTSFIPMVLGFGCNVPAILACRTLGNGKDRLLTMLAIPFMSCSSRLPLYALFAAAFFTSYQGMVIFSLYLLGIVIGLLTVLLLRPLFKDKAASFFLMEMPKYRKPIWHCIRRRVWIRTWDFISRAGSIILMASIIIWFLSHYSLDSGWLLVDQNGSILQSLGKLITPIFKPLGFDQWQTSVAILCGLMSKETVVSSLNILYSLPGGSEAAYMTLRTIFSPLAAYSLMVFVLLYTPCAATVGVILQESRSYKFTSLAVGYQLLIAWIVSFAVYQMGSLLGLS